MCKSHTHCNPLSAFFKAHFACWLIFYSHSVWAKVKHQQIPTSVGAFKDQNWPEGKQPLVVSFTFYLFFFLFTCHHWPGYLQMLCMVCISFRTRYFFNTWALSRLHAPLNLFYCVCAMCINQKSMVSSLLNNLSLVQTIETHRLPPRRFKPPAIHRETGFDPHY